MTIANDFSSSWKKMIELCGTNFSIEDKAGVVTPNIKLHFMPVGKDDLAVLNSFGLDARVAAALPDFEIVKGMLLTSPTGKVYNVEASHEVMVQDTLIGYRVYML